ncbi:MAG: hypothetical protein NC213_10120 [Acetobacter sp.]|nr:hypothetical protein [Bacteroides sp.]MCM1342089.1 hypothetical protein [Acetobacter sp.]MCM1434302.1 hypothetical protein [Clostridiales bacterium]
MQKSISFSKKFVLICLSFVMLLSYPLNVYAMLNNNNNGQADIMYTTIETNKLSISISGIKASCNASMTSKKSTTLKIKMELQKKKSSGYETVETWTNSRTGNTLALSKSRNINVFCDYRLKVTFTAGSESTTLYKYPS